MAKSVATADIVFVHGAMDCSAKRIVILTSIESDMWSVTRDGAGVGQKTNQRSRSMDLISRQEAIEALGEEPEVWNALYEEMAARNQWQADVDAIKAVPSAEPNKWIPCSERLPEENGTYLVSYEDDTVPIDWFNGKWFFYHTNPAIEETGTIIAWMPLPEPYKSEGVES